MKTIDIEEVQSASIRNQAKADSLKEITLIGTYDRPGYEGDNDQRIRLYDLGGIRVADTNGDPVWEETDRALFGEMLAEYGVEY